MPATADDVPAAQQAQAKSEPEPTSTIDVGSLDYAVFADGNYAVSSSHRSAMAPAHRAFNWAGADGGISNGFALEWLGADLSYRYKSLSLNTKLRFGDAAKVLLRDRSGGGNLVPLAEGYLAWNALEQLSFELGQFGSSIGSERYDSYRNLNYSQGALFGLLQPWWHTGVRVRAQLGEAVGLEAIVVNGVNSTFDEDDAPSGGLRIKVEPTSALRFELGGYHTFDSAKDTSGYDTVIDAVARVVVGDLQLSATGMLNQVSEDPVPFSDSTSGEDQRAQPRGGTLWGGSLVAAYRLHQVIQIAGRYEYVRDIDGLKMTAEASGARLQTATLTVDVRPFEDVSGFAVRWDNRVEWSNRALFVNTTEDPSRRWFGSTLGFVLSTAP